MSELLDLSACSLAERFKNRSVTPVDYAHALLDHIARWEPHLNALCRFDPARVRDEALASTRRWAAGAPLSEIDGVPVTIKELIASTVAVVIGKTTVPDYAMLSSGLSSLYGITRNPWRLDLNPGGSSSGAAAAAAAGYGPLHVGTDIGGSIRLPAGWCGIVGFKPSNGRIPIEPYYTGRCAGPMTRTIDDAALLMRFLSRPDWRDATSLPPETIDWSIAPAHVKGMRIGLMLDAGCGLAPDPQIVAAVEAAAERFAAHGARIVAAPPVLSRPMLEGLDRFWRARLWADLERLPDAARARILPYIAEWAGQGASVSGVEAVRGFGATFEMRAAAARLFQSVDAVLSPTNVVTGFPAEWAGPTDDPARPFEHIAFTVPWNMGEQPALSINCGFARDGMPIGLQIVGPRFADRLVLQLGRAYEAWRGEMPRWPAPPR